VTDLAIAAAGVQPGYVWVGGLSRASLFTIALNPASGQSITRVAAAAITTGNVLNVPAGAANGDLLLAWCLAGPSSPPPTGWTTIISEAGVFTDGREYVAMRRVTSGDPSTWTFTLGAIDHLQGAICLRGVDTTTPVAASAKAYDTGGFTAPSVTTSVAGCYVMSTFSVSTIVGGPPNFNNGVQTPYVLLEASGPTTGPSGTNGAWWDNIHLGFSTSSGEYWGSVVGL
jgi:hypothetical protein